MNLDKAFRRTLREVGRLKRPNRPLCGKKMKHHRHDDYLPRKKLIRVTPSVTLN